MPSAEGVAPWRLEHLAEPDALLPLADAVDRIVAQRALPSPYLTVEYLHPVARQAPGAFDWRAVYRGEQLVGLLPFMRTTHARGPLRWPRLESPRTDPQLPGDWLLDPGEPDLLPWVLQTLRRERDWADAYLRRVPPDSPLLAAVDGTMLTARQVRAPFVTALAATWDEHVQRYSSKRQRAMRAVLRMEHLGEAGNAHLEEHLPGAGMDVERLVAATEAILPHTWKTGTVSLEAYSATTTAVIRGLAARDRVVGITLRVAGRPVAVYVSLAYGRRLFPYLTAFLPEAAAASPGTLVLIATLQYGCAHGFTEVHYGNDAAYLGHLATGRSTFHEVRVFNTTVRGRLARGMAGAGVARRAIRPEASS